MNESMTHSLTQSVGRSVGRSVCLSVCLSVCQSVSLSVCQSVSLSVSQSSLLMCHSKKNSPGNRPSTKKANTLFQCLSVRYPASRRIFILSLLFPSLFMAVFTAERKQ